MLDTVRDFIESHSLLRKDAGVALVALSGGADSVCLLLMLRQLGYEVEAVHCNFKLRGSESDHDEEFVKDLCAKHHVALHITHFDTRAYASLHHVSIEMAARTLRYSYFEQLRRDIDAQAVCVAHHQDDSVETVLLNLLRTTGLRGMTGIKPRNGHVVRPLLCLSRHDIEQWLQCQSQEYVTDSSNLLPDVMRNRLRLQVLPILKTVNPSASVSILATASHLAEALRVYDAAMRPLLETLGKERSIDIPFLLSQPSPLSVLYEWLTPFGFTPSTIEAVCHRLPQAQAGRQWASTTHQIVVSGNRLMLAELMPALSPLAIPEQGIYRYGDGSRFRISEQQGASVVRARLTCCLDAAAVHFPLTIRPVQRGDRFHPFGMKGSKLVSDFLADRKMPLTERRRQLAITDAQGRIVWLVDQRPDQRFSVSSSTASTLVIQHETSLPT